MMRRFVWLILLWGLGACTSPELACDDPLGCVTVEPGAPLVLVALLDISGPAADLSSDVLQGMVLAMAQRENSLLEHELSLVTYDAQCQMTGGSAAARQIVAEEDAVAVLGSICTESAAGALPLFAAAGMALVSPANTNPALGSTAVFSPPSYFRTIPSYLRQAEVMAQFAAQALEAKTAVLLFNDSSYSEGLRESFVSAFLEAGGTVPFQTRFDSGSSLDVMLQVAALNRPDVIYLPLYEAEATAVLNQAASVAGLENVTYLGPDSLLMPSFMPGTGTAVTSFYVSGYAVRGAAYDSFLTSWAANYGAPPSFPYAAFAYDATDLLLSAIARSAQQASNGTLLIGRLALRQTLANTANHAGLTGLLTCSESGECAANSTTAIFRLTGTDQLNAPWPPPVTWPPVE